jgi:hypothetical protein
VDPVLDPLVGIRSEQVVGMTPESVVGIARNAQFNSIWIKKLILEAWSKAHFP